MSLKGYYRISYSTLNLLHTLGSSVFGRRNYITNSLWLRKGIAFRIKSLNMFVASDWYTLQVSDFASLAYVKWLIWATKKVMLNNISLRFTLDLVCSVGWHFAIGNFQSVCFHSQRKQNFIRQIFPFRVYTCCRKEIWISCGYHIWVTIPCKYTYHLV